MEDIKIKVMIMSGVEDGSLIEYGSGNGDGLLNTGKWTIGIGRRDDNDLCLRNDTFISRLHAKLHWMDKHWWLEDCDSTNGTFIERPGNFFTDERVKGIIPIVVDQLFRVGRTWLRIQFTE